MNISKRCFVRIISFLTAIVIVTGIYAVQGMQRSDVLKTRLEYDMMRSVEELSSELDNIKNTLNKGIYAGTPAMMSQLSAKLWSDSCAAKASLSQLPVSELHLENTYKFLSQVGNYSKSLAERYSEGQALSEEDRKNLASLAEYARTLSDNMWSVQQKINSGELSFEKTESGIQGAGEESEPDYITEGFTDFEEGYDNYPTLIYDGPFSDHIMEKEPEMLKNAKQVSLDEAKSAAERASLTSCLEHTDEYDEQGKMPSYIFSTDAVTVAVTKKGGYVCYMMKPRAVQNRTISAHSAIELADEYLESLGVDDMTDTYYEIRDNICTINFAAEENDVVMYTDLIKVSVAMDNGEITAFDARGYITNHTERKLAAPSISEKDAMSKVSQALKINSSQLCVIPSSGTNELYCYEFSCQSDSGEQVLVYINAGTAKEEQILLLQISENGTLTV